MTASQSDTHEGQECTDKESFDSTDADQRIISYYRQVNGPAIWPARLADDLDEMSEREALETLEDLEREGLFMSKKVGENRVWWMEWHTPYDQLDVCRERYPAQIQE